MFLGWNAIPLLVLITVFIVGGGVLARMWGYRCSNEYNGCRHSVDTWHFRRAWCSEECKAQYLNDAAKIAAKNAERAEAVSKRRIVK